MNKKTKKAILSFGTGAMSMGIISGSAIALASCKSSSDDGTKPADDIDVETTGSIDSTDWEGRTSGTLTYEINDKNRTVTYVSNLDYRAHNLVIPGFVTDESRWNYQVIIADNAFSGDINLTGTLTISHGVLSIGDNAFLNCVNLTGNLKFPNSIISIGKSAFKNCNSFNGELLFPYNNSFKEISDSAFSGCSSFTGSINMPYGIKKIGAHAFENCSGFNNYLYLDSPEEIGAYAFANCSKLTAMSGIGNEVVSIGEYAFYNCKSIARGLTLSSNNELTTISAYAFAGCSGFSGFLRLPDNVKTIESHAFYDCGFTGKLVIGGNVETIADNAFGKCDGFSALEFIQTDPTLLQIDDYAFSNWQSNGRVWIPKDSNVSAWDKSWIPGSLTATKWEIINNQETIGLIDGSDWIGRIDGTLTYRKYEYANTIIYEGNNNYQAHNLIIPAMVTDGIRNYIVEIGREMFKNNANITGTLTITDGICSIGNEAFYGCSQLTGDLVIPDSVVMISINTFTGTKWVGNVAGNIYYSNVNENGNKWLLSAVNPDTSISVPNGVFDNVIGIAGNAFKNCNNYTGNLVIPNNVLTISYEAFYGCKGFNGTLTLPNNLISLGSYAFYNCSNFTGNLIIPNGINTIEPNTFYNCSGFTGSLIIPNSVDGIMDYAFYNCTGFDGTLTMPRNISWYGYRSFYNCSGFTGKLVINLPELDSNGQGGGAAIQDYAFYGCSGFEELEFFQPNPERLLFCLQTFATYCNIFAGWKATGGTVYITNGADKTAWTEKLRNAELNNEWVIENR